jgi:tetratricopeptide (TPR) repeat protein
MKKVFSFGTFGFLFFQLLFLNVSHAQLLTVPPGGGNKKAAVIERIGITDVVIHYDRPGVKGREGKIWGTLIPVGYADLGFGSSKESPWRAGANENTTISFSSDVSVEGQPLAAGKYAFFVAYDPNECTLIFSKNSNSWGSFFYDPKEDVLRVKVKPAAVDKSVEWLKYEFTNQTENSAVVALQWEKMIIPFKIAVDLDAIQLESFKKELRTDKGFLWESWTQAAQWCLQKNINLEQALLWSDTATSVNFGGDRSFQALSTKAQILDKLGRTAESTEIMKKALPFANMQEIHQYGRQLLAQKKNKEAFDAFKLNYDRNPNQFTTNMGMARGYSSLGEYKKALEFAQKAAPQAPDKANKDNVDRLIKTLQDGKDIN